MIERKTGYSKECGLILWRLQGYGFRNDVLVLAWKSQLRGTHTLNKLVMVKAVDTFRFLDIRNTFTRRKYPYREAYFITTTPRF